MGFKSDSPPKWKSQFPSRSLSMLKYKHAVAVNFAAQAQMLAFAIPPGSRYTRRSPANDSLPSILPRCKMPPRFSRSSGSFTIRVPRHARLVAKPPLITAFIFLACRDRPYSPGPVRRKSAESFEDPIRTYPDVPETGIHRVYRNNM